MAPSRSSETARRAGILLHPTSLPGPFGIGDIGPTARRFVRWLASAEQQIWLMLPIHPTDGHGSPYASPSAFARSPMLLSIEDLTDDGWLLAGERPYGIGRPDKVAWRDVMLRKPPSLDTAGRRVAEQVDLDAWSDSRAWVGPWALFATVAEEHGNDWTAWPEAIRSRDRDALDRIRDEHADRIAIHTAHQWLFEQQWGRLRTEARHHGVELWGDLPFFVGGQSCDVWWQPELFRLDDNGRPLVVSGVPPDDFTPEGQHWGTPLYDEARHAKDGHAWWCSRLDGLMTLFDKVRLDHFRGIHGVWEIPVPGKPIDGRWIDGPGAPLLTALRNHLGELPLIAEDLGVITDPIHALRDQFDLPGMVVLQFAFEDAKRVGDHRYLPHNHRMNQVVLPGTHDNDTTLGWYLSSDERTQDHVRRYLTIDGMDVAHDMLRCAYRSVASTAIVAMQDVLSLPTSARMNTPGTEGGNWSWRMSPGAMNVAIAETLAHQARMSGRQKPAPVLASVDQPDEIAVS